MLVSGVLEKIEDIYGSTQIEFILRTKIYSKLLEDYINRVNIPFEKADKIINHYTINKVLRGEKVTIEILFNKLFGTEEIKRYGIQVRYIKLWKSKNRGLRNDGNF